MRRSGVVIACVLCVASLTAPASAIPRFTPPARSNCFGPPPFRGNSEDLSFEWVAGYDEPTTPNSLDRVGVLKIGPDAAPNVLILNPGASSGAARFVPMGRDIVRLTNGRWQVWSIERRENQFEDQSVADLAKQGVASLQQVYD